VKQRNADIAIFATLIFSLTFVVSLVGWESMPGWCTTHRHVPSNAAIPQEICDWRLSVKGEPLK